MRSGLRDECTNLNFDDTWLKIKLDVLSWLSWVRRSETQGRPWELLAGGATLSPTRSRPHLTPSVYLSLGQIKNLWVTPWHRPGGPCLFLRQINNLWVPPPSHGSHKWWNGKMMKWDRLDGSYQVLQSACDHTIIILFVGKTIRYSNAINDCEIETEKNNFKS